MSWHRFAHLFRLSWHSLVVNRLRSVLTTLGIVLGVASVIVMLAIGEAARFEAVRQIQELGATNIIIRSVKPPSDGKENTDQYILTYGLTRDDLERISTLPTVQAQTPQREFRKDIRRREQKIEGRVVAVYPNYQTMNGLNMASGRFISQTDSDRFENVVVLGAELADILFPLEDPLGRTVSIEEGYYYRVIGITARRGASISIGSNAAGQSYDRDMYMPFSTDRIRNGDVLVSFKVGTLTAERLEVSQLTVEVAGMENVQRTAALIQGTLDQFHPRKDYEITVPLDLLERAERAQRIFTLVLGAIGSISLIVGGIGIMNIMLATVTERTREIGVRRASAPNAATLPGNFWSRRPRFRAWEGLSALSWACPCPLSSVTSSLCRRFCASGPRWSPLPSPSWSAWFLAPIPLCVPPAWTRSRRCGIFKVQRKSRDREVMPRNA